MRATHAARRNLDLIQFLRPRRACGRQKEASTACAINTNLDMIGPQVRPILSTHQTIERPAGDETALLATTTQKTEQNTPHLFLRDGLAFAFSTEALPRLECSVGFRQQFGVLWENVQKSVKQITAALNSDLPLIAHDSEKVRQSCVTLSKSV